MPRSKKPGPASGSGEDDFALPSLNKYIAASGFCSRREADKLIEQARVSINGNLVVGPARVKPGDRVEIDGEPIKAAKKEGKDRIVIACNKPVGITSTTDTADRTNIISFLAHPKRIFPVGRLDKDSDGLILLTNDGDLVNKILRAGNRHEKEYLVTVDKPMTPEIIKQLSSGVRILNDANGKWVTTMPCKVWAQGPRGFRIVLQQGLNRQIRRMCSALGYEVTALRRTRIMHIALGSLAVGKWRYLTADELQKLDDATRDSSKT